MRLIRSNQSPREAAPLTPEAVFESKYDWLLRWALHFTKNDRTAAEDLVQDAFVRLVTSWPRIKDNIEQIEPVLYSYLKYCYLTEIRRGQRFNFQELDLIEFDDLRLGLHEDKTADPILVQDNLRRVVAYLCWRKQSAKSASVLLFRFFHGYFPDEIARIALMKRGSIDELLRIAREEVKGYLADPASVEIIRYGRPPELMPRQVAVSAERFAEELRATILQARPAPCLPEGQLLKLYAAAVAKPLPVGLLAHIVSCERCLELVSSSNGLDLPGKRSQGGESASMQRPRGKSSGSSSKTSRDDIRRSILGGMDRFRKLYEHRPRALMIVVNGDVVAMRDINSASSELKVQVGPDKPMGIVEVLSEQGMPMLTLYAPSLPPEAPPELRHEVALSGDRRLELVLSFTGEGAVIDMHYSDPLFLAAANEKSQVQSELEDRSDEPGIEMVSSDAKDAVSDRPSWWRRLLDKVTRMATPEFNPLFVTATVFAVASVVCFFLYHRSSPAMKPEDLLKQAVVAQLAPSHSGAPGVAVQTVRIQTAHRKTERTLYRDVQGKRHAREQMEDREDTVLRSQLEAVGVRWNDPLAADSFRDWHDGAAMRRDSVRQSDQGLLTLTTTVASGAVSSESLTVRASDFHPVQRTIELRDAGTVEIAEVSYSVLPWSAVNPDIFEPLAAAPTMEGRNLHASLLPHLPPGLTPEQIDSAELSVRLVLNRLGLDASSRIEISRSADGVHVQGLVDSDVQKRQLQAQLYLVPHVLPSILTMQEMEARPSTGSEISSIRQTTVADNVPSSLEKYFTEQTLNHNEVGPTAREFVESSFAVKHESEEITGLLQRFGASTSLSSESRTALSELLIQHKSRLLAALGREERALLAAQLIVRPANVSVAGDGSGEGLRGDAEKNFALCVELTSGSDGASRSAQAIAPQLANSIAELRAVALHISAAAQLSPPSPGTAGIASKNE